MTDANSRALQLQQEILEITINTQEAERSRIAEDLHNSLGQLLYGVKLRLDSVNLEAPQQQRKNDASFKDAKDVLSLCIKECRRISHDLMPAILEDYGLREAVQDICGRYSGTVRFHCHLSGSINGLPKYLKTAIYRIVQELVMNVVKHANATIVSF